MINDNNKNEPEKPMHIPVALIAPSVLKFLKTYIWTHKESSRNFKKSEMISYRENKLRKRTYSVKENPLLRV